MAHHRHPQHQFLLGARLGWILERSQSLAALVRPSSSRPVSSCGWVALCERRRAGFARLSGWQPVGIWVVSAGEFSSIAVSRRRYPDNEQKNRDAQFVPEKWPEAQAERVAGVHVFSSQEGAETIPRDGVYFFQSQDLGRTGPAGDMHQGCLVAVVPTFRILRRKNRGVPRGCSSSVPNTW
jgi:hypothetical protein